MKERTPKTKSSTFNIEWLGIREDEEAYGRKPETLNAQRSTLKVQRESETHFDLEERLLEFSTRIIRLVDALPNTRAANHLAGQLLRCGTSPLGITARSRLRSREETSFINSAFASRSSKKPDAGYGCCNTLLVPVAKMALILEETEELIKIFAASVRTAEKNAK
jgi:hypothetical protein